MLNPYHLSFNRKNGRGKLFFVECFLNFHPLAVLSFILLHNILATTPHTLPQSVLPLNEKPYSNQMIALNHSLEPPQQMSYQDWIALLRREAEVASLQKPKHLTLLAGDSLTQWFPRDLLPKSKVWLNQGIPGETSTGLLKRLQLLETTEPETLFVMIGINDLLQGVTDEALLANQQQIIENLRRVHPQSQIVVQSILPHARQRLMDKIPNSRIRNINEQLKAIATQEGALYLDLHPLFTDTQGNLRPELGTDGLHLSRQGYQLWFSALKNIL